MMKYVFFPGNSLNLLFSPSLSFVLLTTVTIGSCCTADNTSVCVSERVLTLWCVFTYERKKHFSVLFFFFHLTAVNLQSEDVVWSLCQHVSLGLKNEAEGLRVSECIMSQTEKIQNLCVCVYNTVQHNQWWRQSKRALPITMHHNPEVHMGTFLNSNHPLTFI